MLGCAFVIERNVRKLGKAGLESLTASMKGNRLKSVLGDAGDQRPQALQARRRPQ